MEDVRVLYEKCVIVGCSNYTRDRKGEHIDYCVDYIEGAGSICASCRDKIYAKVDTWKAV